MAHQHAADAPRPHLTGSGLARLVTVFTSLVASAALFFAAAGTLSLPRAWAYYGALLGYLLLAVPGLLLLVPGAVEVVNERGRLRREGLEPWDQAFARAYTVLLLVQPAVAGLDAGRLHWGEVPAALAPPAVALSILATMLAHWAMAVNRWAETGARIQRERHQEVVTAGPYRLVRHPFYLASILIELAYPAAVGSLLAAVPALAAAALLAWRTAREDGLLRAGLAGYQAYASRVRYRLLPGVW